MISGRRHFSTFDALRFFAFLKVFLLHLPITAFPILNFIKNGGEMGVHFFFVLSGFLITYIILEEKEQTGQLNLRAFFMRRVLRIWPLYYAMVLVAFLTPYILSIIGLPFSPEGYEPNWLLTLSFLENYKMILTNSFPNVSPLRVMWSICVEEHFYLAWGLLLWKMPRNRLSAFFLCTILIAIFSRSFFIQHQLPTIDLFTNLDLFTYGAIPAYLLTAQKNRFDDKIRHISMSWKKIIVCAIIVFVFLQANYQYPGQIFTATIINGVMFSLLICLTLPKQQAITIKNNSLFYRLGKYTYGLYLVHTLVLNFLWQVFRKAHIDTGIWVHALAYIFLSFLVSLALAVLCYYVIEKPFLQLKRFFYKSKVVTEPSAFA